MAEEILHEFVIGGAVWVLTNLDERIGRNVSRPRLVQDERGNVMWPEPGWRVVVEDGTDEGMAALQRFGFDPIDERPKD